MERLYGFITILFLVACGGSEALDDGSDDTSKPGKPRDGKLRDAGAQVDAGPLAGDSGNGGADSARPPADASAIADSSVNRDAAPNGDASATNDSSAPGDAFEGRWAVTLTATADTTCTNTSQYSPRIVDTWTFEGSTLRGEHIGPNALEREPGTDVWNLGTTATADLEIVARELRGTFIFYWAACDIFYDVTGSRAP